MKKYDVGIYGLWYGNNYGSIITYYALSKVLDELGFTYAMIRNPLGREIDIDSLERSHPLKFAREKYQITKLRPLSRLHELNELFNGFLIGSDQMWNYHLSRPYQQSYFLDFADDNKIKIAYATSFGKDRYIGPEEEKPVTQRNLQRFDAISVRDDFSKRICEKDFNVPAEIVLDPVFLCPVEKYEELIAETSDFKIDEEYIFAYILDPNPQIGASIQKIAQDSGKKVIVVFNQSGDKEKLRSALQVADEKVSFLLDPTVKEWLYLFKNACFVLTDSFHGSCFSIIFRKPFIVMKNNGRGGSRFPFLLGNFGLLDRMVEMPNGIYEKFVQTGLECKIDYEKVYSIINKEKERAFKWLETALQKKQVKPKAIPSILDMKQCTGCGACVSACPKDALSLQQDKWGYYRSTLNVKLCIDCGLCSKICPALSLPRKTNKKEPQLYAFIAADEKILYSSSSGGIFPLLANEAFRRGGCVAGAAWTDDLHVEHILIENKEELHKLQKSKYLQSYLGDFDRKIKEKLDAGRYVLFTGCPCQVTGLKAYLGKDYDNLITVDLLCGNSPSSEFFQKYLKDSFPKGVKDYQFRYKKQGWNSDCLTLTLTLTDGTKIERRGGGQDDYQKLYHPHVMCPPHCEQCKYQALPRFGDITIGDFWGYSKHDSSIDTSKGISVVLCNNEKGQAFFDSITDKAIKVKKTVPLEWLGGNGYAYAGHNYCSPNRDKFYKAIQTMPFSEAMKTALTPNKLSSYPDPLSLQPLHYDTSQLRFRFDENMWEEHFVNGVTFLTTKVTDPPLGNYAVIPLTHPLVKGKRYRLSVRFKVKTKSKEFSFHIKGSDSKKIQVIYVHTVKPENAVQWVTVKTDFIPGGNMYDEFMIGSAHIRGEERFFAVDYIDISEVETANQELKNQLTWMTNAANFFESLSKDYFSDHKFDSFIKGMSGKKIAVLKTQDRAGQILLKAAEVYGVQVVFSSSKVYLKQLTDEEWQMCKTADKIVCCCIHGSVPDEREGIKAIAITDII